MTQKEINYLGSLLHDIGKFKWRAQERKSGEDHETLGTFFIREYLGKFQPLKVQIEELIKAANRVTGKIWKADIIAAQEREQQKYGDPRRPLISIFQRLSVKEGIDPPDTIYYYNPQRVNIDLEFPINSNQNIHNFTYDKNDIIKQHEILWKDFIKEIENIKQVIKDYESFFETFYSLLEKYTSYVLSAGYKSYPDIPLFDHSRVVSALSVCYDEGDDDNECILIEGDISGIQDYIYQNIYQTNKVA
ncbi:MAG: HD domain-containing protein, partial [Ignavibacteria bacterium]|nr:HD domain-containing protein [Ignavibacteria bacterium]